MSQRFCLNSRSFFVLRRAELKQNVAESKQIAAFRRFLFISGRFSALKAVGEGAFFKQKLTSFEILFTFQGKRPVEKAPGAGTR